MRFATLCAATALLASTVAFAEGDPVEGEDVFIKCRSCHQIGEDAKHSVGPILTGVIGRTAGTADGYRYGKDLASAGEAGLIWTEEEIFAYIEDPKAYIRTYLDNERARVKMTFSLDDEQERMDVIAYLATFSAE